MASDGKLPSTEDDVCKALGISMMEHLPPPMTREVDYEVFPNPKADGVDLSDLRGIKAQVVSEAIQESSSDPDLEALAEIVPKLKAKRTTIGNSMTVNVPLELDERKMPAQILSPALACVAEETPIEVEADLEMLKVTEGKQKQLGEKKSASLVAIPSQSQKRVGNIKNTDQALPFNDSMQVQESAEDLDDEESSGPKEAAPKSVKDVGSLLVPPPRIASDSGNEEQNLGGFDDDVNSDVALDTEFNAIRPARIQNPKLEYNQLSSAASLSTATQTQTHEVRMPMYLPTFKPATGCTNASDFIVRCFVARLRSGITVVKHGRSRWCKSRLRVLHIHPDGRSLSWKPAVGEPASSKRPPKLDLSTCTEVRHAWSPDPLNPMFTGTAILRQKCEAANAHKSFALIFPKRTVDITAVTADQCKVLMEGFSALCFRLQVANLAGRGGKKGRINIGEEEVASTTASNTLTNNSTSLSPSGGGLTPRMKNQKHSISVSA